MSHSFAINLNDNSFQLGNVAKGQIVDVKADFNLNSNRGSAPFGGVVTGSFLGEIQAGMNIPDTIPFQQAPSMHSLVNNGFNIIIVGVGGTGGYLVRDLTRFLFALKEKGDTRSFNLTLIDPDLVEKKNILRQNFTTRDEGKPKAEVLAQRHSAAFGLEIQTVLEFATASMLDDLLRQPGANNLPLTGLIIGCVDNNAARREIAKALRNRGADYWIDSGNESKSGQVVLGYGAFGGGPWFSTPKPMTPFSLPNVIDLYPEIKDEALDPKKDEKDSCAERSLVDTQNIFVNMAAAGYALNFVRQVITKEAITIGSIEFNIKGVTTPWYITKYNLSKAYKLKQPQGTVT